MLKKSMDIIDVYTYIKTSAEELVECYVDNAYRYKYAWLLKLRCRGGIKLLKIEPGQRVHVSKTEPVERIVDKFSQYLRAHVKNSKVVRVSMPWWERVIVLETSKSGKTLRHYVELVPRGVWVITGLDGKILYASKFEVFKDRAIKLGVDYVPPPPKGLNPWNFSNLVDSLKRSKDLVRGIVSNWGLPGYIAEELLLRAGLYSAKNSRPDSVRPDELAKLVEEYAKLVEESSRGLGYLVYGPQGLEAYFPYKPRLFLEVYEREVRELARFEEAVDAYFCEYESQQEAREREEKLRSEFESWKKRVEEQEKLVGEYRQRLEDLEKTLSIIYENYARLEELVECARRLHYTKGWSSVIECGIKGYRENDGVVFVEISGINLEFNIREDFTRQVLELAKRRGELEKKLKKAVEVLESLKSKTLELEKELTKKVYVRPAPIFWYEKFRWTITRNGFLVIAGKDASQNESIVKKYLGEDDYFLHADVHGAPATVLLKMGREPDVVDLENAAVIAASYSRAWKAGFSYVEVYWVRGSQVSKTPPSGEYISKGAFMVYGERTYTRVPLRLGIGLRLFCDTIYGDYIKLFVGSPDFVKEVSMSYVVIVPGDEEVLPIAEQISRILAEHAYRKSGVLYEIQVRHVAEALPGPSRIVEFGAGMGETFCPEI